ncbi:MAG TPA: 3-hydroxyacyl-ACP dehydratase FabZ [Fredinandcohnia sp.]|nr:3-hydroxyacyl-ACP dehydratase FabZ [Fredinandcohnia sp.]
MMEREGDFRRILEILPHRYPFLLVDRIVEVEPGARVLAYKNVSFNEPFFEGHFPGNPVMPGVLTLEALAQAGAILAFLTEPANLDSKVMYLAAIDGVRFKRPVRPGDRLDLEATIERRKGPVWKIFGRATIAGTLVAEAHITATLADR